MKKMVNNIINIKSTRFSLAFLFLLILITYLFSKYFRQHNIGRNLSSVSILSKGKCSDLASPFLESGLKYSAKKRLANQSLGELVSTERTSRVLVLNAGSSSLKLQFIDADKGKSLASALVERIGDDAGTVTFKTFSSSGVEKKTVLHQALTDHRQALEILVKLLTDKEAGIITDVSDITTIGHRIVHGGEDFNAPTLITNKVKEKIRKSIPLAPLHNPVNLEVVEIAEKIFPNANPVAIFDTAFHQTMPEEAYRYAIPDALYREHNIRKYGFHGTSHAYVSRTAATWLKKNPEDLNLISIHIGNGASITAIKNGKSIDTSMGMTPLEGLVMGTRSGDIDGSIPGYLIKELGMTSEEVDRILNKESGMKGLTGLSDLRDIIKKYEAGDKQAELAIKIYTYRIRKYIGEYAVALGRVDGIIFTGGVGENSDLIRRLACEDMDILGLKISPKKNLQKLSTIRSIHARGSRIKILVVPTNEELEIAQQSYGLIKKMLKIVGDVHGYRVYKNFKIKAEFSADHIHLSEADFISIFGEEYSHKILKELYLKNNFAAEETVEIVGEGGVKKVRILLPFRKQTQVEVSKTTANKLKLTVPIRKSGDLQGSGSITIRGPQGEIKLKEGAIRAKIHIHVSHDDAINMGIKNGEKHSILVGDAVPTQIDDVVLRVHDKGRYGDVTTLHMDTDQAKIVGIGPDSKAYIITD